MLFHPVPRVHLTSLYGQRHDQGKKPIKMQNLDIVMFAEKMPDPEALWVLPGEPDILCNTLSELLYSTAKACKKKYRPSMHPTYADSSTRWQRILESKDPQQLWQSINWKGEFDALPDKNTQPTDADFCQYYKAGFAPIT
jgi:hypothetical protein